MLKDQGLGRYAELLRARLTRTTSISFTTIATVAAERSVTSMLGSPASYVSAAMIAPASSMSRAGVRYRNRSRSQAPASSPRKARNAMSHGALRKPMYNPGSVGRKLKL